MAWFTEQCFPDWTQSYKLNNMLFSKKTKYQTINIFNTERFGRVLALDNIIQCTEYDEYVYHEMMVHVPINAYGDARSVLIIGGGDGGVLEEVLKHNSVRRVVMVEIDQEVVEAAKTFLSSICKDAFDDPRVNLIIADAVGYVAITDDKFDVIIIDRSDSVGPNVDLYSKSFYQDCKRLLTSEGILVAQNGSLFLSRDFVIDQMKITWEVWNKSGCYTLTLPTYPGGLTSILWTADWDISRSDIKEPVLGLRYYNEDIHRAAFALPNFMVER